MAIYDVIQIQAPKAKLLIEIDNDIEWIDIKDLEIDITNILEQDGVSDELIDGDILWEPTRHDFKPIYKKTVEIEGHFSIKDNQEFREKIKNEKYNIKILDGFVITKDDCDTYKEPYDRISQLEIIECKTFITVIIDINGNFKSEIFYFQAQETTLTKKEVINMTTNSIIDELLQGIKDDI